LSYKEGEVFGLGVTELIIILVIEKNCVELGNILKCHITKHNAYTAIDKTGFEIV